MSKKVLILGDGNFSFSCSFCSLIEELGKENEVNQVICSSFDSEHEVLTKYPESVPLLKALRKLPFVVVQHQVDATKILDSFQDLKFDEIIFNFPHLGFENLGLHQALIAHIMDSVKNVLVEKGVFVLSLAQSQEIGWEINQSAIRLGLKLVDKIAVKQDLWPGYMLKRHHTGKSFKNRVQDCYHYVFRLNGSAEDGISLFQSLAAIRASILLNPSSSTAINHENNPKDIQSESTKGNEQGKNKKRKVHQLVEGHYDEIRTGTDGFSSKIYRCKFCQREFPLEQGIRTHVYTVHILPTLDADRHHHEQRKFATSSTTIENPSSAFTCELCSKFFPNEDALFQHNLVKHQIPDERKNVQEAKETLLEEDHHRSDNDSCKYSYQCNICLMKFPDESQLTAHQSNIVFQPRNAEAIFRCEVCGEKSFHNERALSQHMKFCSIATTKKIDTTNI